MVKLATLVFLITVSVLTSAPYAQVPVTPAVDQLALLKSADPVLAKNKHLVFDYFREVLEAGRPDLLEKYVTADFVQHDPGMASGRDSFAAIVKARSPQPRPIQSLLRSPLVTVVAEGDLVVMVFVKSFQSAADPGKQYTTTSAEIYRVAQGKIVEHWGTAAKK